MFVSRSVRTSLQKGWYVCSAVWCRRAIAKPEFLSRRFETTSRHIGNQYKNCGSDADKSCQAKGLFITIFLAVTPRGVLTMVGTTLWARMGACADPLIASCRSPSLEMMSDFAASGNPESVLTPFLPSTVYVGTEAMLRALGAEAIERTRWWLAAKSGHEKGIRGSFDQFDQDLELDMQSHNIGFTWLPHLPACCSASQSQRPPEVLFPHPA